MARESPEERARRWDLDRREQRWRRELDRSAQRHRWAYDRRQRDAVHRIDRHAEDAERELERSLRAAERRGGYGHGYGSGPRMPGQGADDVAFVAATILFIPLVVLPLVAGHLSALVVNGGWPSYRLTDAPGVLGRLASNPGDPSAAWEPVNTGTPVPGPVAWWTVLVVLLALCGLVALNLYRGQRAKGDGWRWATLWQQRGLQVRPGERHRVVVGTNGSRKLAPRDQHSILVVGPPHAGKTSGVAIPALLEWQGPVVVATTNTHVVDQTIGWRSRQGDVHVFDPAGMTPYHKSGWSPLATCTTWAESIRTAQNMTAGVVAALGDSMGQLTGVGPHPPGLGSAAMSLAPFLFAAAATGRSILDVIEWIERDEHEEIQQILLSIDRGAAHAHSLSFAQPNEDRTAYLRLMREMLSVYEDPVVARSLDRHEIVTGELLDGGDHTLYVAVPEHDQARFRPLGATVIRQILAAAYEQAAATAGRLRPPLLVVLDEVVGLTTADDLTAVASAGAARGVQIVSVFQDVEQVEMAYGDSANRLIESHAAWLLLPNAHDADYSDDSGLAIPPDVARQLKEGEGALCYGATPPVRVRLRPWFRDRRLRRMAATPQDAVSPAERGDPATTFVAAEQVSAWHRRRPAEAPPDPTIPVDTDDPGFTDVFGSLDADSLPENVTRFPGSRPWFRR